MRVFFLIVFSLFLAACNKTSTVETAPTVFAPSVQIEGVYKTKGYTGPQKFVFKSNGELEFHEYYSDGKLSTIKKANFNVVDKTINVTGNNKFSFKTIDIKENGDLVISGISFLVKVPQ